MKKNLRKWISAFRGKKLVVWGDLVADHMLYGDSSRISREAPVLILQKAWESTSPGSAGNAVMNVASLGGIPIPVGVTGRDAMGRKLCRIFKSHGIDTSHVVHPTGVETAVKMRVLAGGLHTVKQQVIRIDSGGNYEKASERDIVKHLRAALRRADGFMVSDYGLGTVCPKIFTSLAKKNSALCIVDSRHALSDFRGAFSATPNEPELAAWSDKFLGTKNGSGDALEKTGRSLLRRLRMRALLVTRGKRGMALFEPRKKRIDVPIFGSEDIVDVTGAGDTVLAAYTLSLAAGAPFCDAARLANVAGGLAVMKRGAAAVTAEELYHALT